VEIANHVSLFISKLSNIDITHVKAQQNVWYGKVSPRRKCIDISSP